MTLPVAREMPEHGIRLMAIAPGLFETPMVAGLPEESRESLGIRCLSPRALGVPRSTRPSFGT